jgi:lipopolysaccharide transport system ATP-binding protein
LSEISTPAIAARGLGKKYRVTRRAPAPTIREALGSIPTRLLAKRPGSPNGVVDTWALRDIDLEIAPGSSVGILGRNGAGKSTLLKIIARVTRPTEGFVDVRGRVASLLEVGAGFHPELTGRENIRLYGAILGMSSAEVQRRFDRIVEFAEISGYLDAPVKRYSSGMYMRLAFAVAAHLDPEILLVDEILAVGDAGFQKKSMSRVGDVAHSGNTVLFVSHNLQAVERLCPVSMILHEGRLVAFGETGAMISRYLTEFSTDSSSGSWLPLESARRHGEGGVRFTRVRYGSGAGDAIPCTRRPFIVECEVEAQRPTTARSFAVMIFDRLGTRLINADSALYEQSLELRSGLNRLKVEIPELGLSPGTYALGLRISRRVREPTGLDFIENAAWFDVTDPDSPFATGMLPEAALASEFRISTLPRDE